MANQDERQRDPTTELRRRAQPGTRRLRFLPPLLFAVIVALILYDQVPAIRNAADRVLRPAEHQAQEVCQRAALAAAAEPRYARVVAPGKVHRTSGAYYVERVVIGEMGADGTETRFTYHCYVDPSGTLIRGARGETPASDPAPGKTP